MIKYLPTKVTVCFTAAVNSDLMSTWLRLSFPGSTSIIQVLCPHQTQSCGCIIYLTCYTAALSDALLKHNE